MQAATNFLISTMLTATVLGDEPFRITRINLAPGGEVTVEVPSDLDHYYVLHQNPDLGEVTTPVDIALGTQGSTQLRDPNSAFPARSFFTVERIPLALPRDSDGDGIDDAYELLHSTFLHPLDSGDASGDPDNNGLTHLQEYLQSRSSQPRLLTTVTAGQGLSDHLTGANSIAVSGNTAYVTAGASDALVILDVSDPTSPQVLSELVDGQAGFDHLAGPRSVFVTGGIAYVAAQLDNALTIIDVSDPANPRLLAEVVDGQNGFNQLGRANCVHVSGATAYVTAHSDFLGGDEALTIIDVSNPANPRLLAELVDDSKTYPAPSEFTRLRGANSVHVSGTTAYVTAGAAIESDEALTILDVSDPSNPRLLAELVDDGSHHMEGPRSVFVSGDTAYVAGSPVGLAYIGGGALTTIDVSDPANPRFLGEAVDESFAPGSGFAHLGGANSVFVDGTTAYITAGADNALTVIDVSDPANPELIAAAINGQDPFPHLVDASSVHVSNGIAYVTATEADPATRSIGGALNIFDLSSLASR